VERRAGGRHRLAEIRHAPALRLVVPDHLSGLDRVVEITDGNQALPAIGLARCLPTEYMRPRRRRGGRGAAPHTRSGGPVAHGPNLGSAARSRTIRSRAAPSRQTEQRHVRYRVPRSATVRRERAPVASRLLLVVHTSCGRSSARVPPDCSIVRSAAVPGADPAARPQRLRWSGAGRCCGKVGSICERPEPLEEPPPS
jgi:hypothetical protein